MAQTHSKGKPLSFIDLCEEAFGVLKMHPWELWEYTMEEYVWKRKGFYDHDKNGVEVIKELIKVHYQHTRLLAYYTILPHLKKSEQKKSIDKIIPDIYSEKVLTKESLSDWYQKRINLARQLDKQKKKKNA